MPLTFRAITATVRRRGLVIALTIALLALPVLPAHAADGWGATLPTNGDVTVPAGTTVVLDTDLDVRVLRIEGTVTCEPGADLTVHAEAILVAASGTLACGTAEDRFDGRLEIVLDGPLDTDHVGAGARSLVVAGRLALHGEQRGRSHRSLATTAPAGATQLRLDDTTGLRPGDELVVTSTDYAQEHDERVEVTAVDGDTVTFRPALAYGHHCATETHGSRDLRTCAAVGLLTRNILLRGADDAASTQVGGHVMAVDDGLLEVDGVELRHMGQEQRLGRYPIHWHLVDDGTGSYLRDSSIVDGFNRFLSIHATDEVEVSGTVGAGTIGHGFYLEDGSESGNTFFCNLGTGVQRPSAADALTPSDVDASVFWISNPDNTVVDNVAVGGFSGFSLSFADAPVGMSSGAPDRPRTTPLREFRGNTAMASHFAGLFIDRGENPDRTTDVTWYSPRVDPDDETSTPVTPHIEDFTATKSRHYGIWLRTFSGARVTGARVADTWRGMYLANVQTKGHDTWATVRDSLVVGESDNVGQGREWEATGPGGRPFPKYWDKAATISGMQIYDGPFEVHDSTFSAFTPRTDRDAGAIGSQTPNDASVDSRNRVSGLEFVDANRVVLGPPGEDGDDGTLVHDLDGSVAGTAGAAITVRGALLDDADCEHRAEWHASVCTDAGYARLFVMRRDTGDADVTVTRVRDGRTAQFTGRGTSKPSLRTDEAHHLSFDAGDDRVGKLQLLVADRSVDEPVVISVPHPGGTPDVTFWNAPRPDGPAGSLAALAELAQGWWFDASAERLHLRIAGRGVTIDGPTTLPPAPSTTSEPTSAPPPTPEPAPEPAPAPTPEPAPSSQPTPAPTPAPEPAPAPTPTPTPAPTPASDSTPDRTTTPDRTSTPDHTTTPGPTTPDRTTTPGPSTRTAPAFADVEGGNVHRGDIGLLARAGITRGCGGDRYCPEGVVTREQMASFLVRALDLPMVPGIRFSDVAPSNPHADDIAALAAAGITRGCGGGSFCPGAVVTREQMASFLTRALDLPSARSAGFDDVPRSNPHADDIAALAAAGITHGCGRDKYCPEEGVTRAQMASFLVRAFDL